MTNIKSKLEPDINFKRLRKRDRKEIENWFETFSDPVYGFIYYRVGKDVDLAGEASQETFTTALESIDKYDPARGEMFPWLTYIARNCIRKVMRRNGKACDLIDFWETVDENLVKSVTNLDSINIPEEILHQKQPAELVSIAITNLPLRYQMALQRHYFEDLSLHEMAILEKSSEGAIKILLHRARQAFRDAFETISASFHQRREEGRIVP
jgi:RNA polymerase sigma-70 factor, ECF subfamily